MTTAVQRRRGTNTEHASFTGLEGELSVNTTNESVHVHDGSTAGGFELARADGSNIVATSIDINGGTIDGTTIGASSASTGAFTTLTATGLDVTGTATMDGLVVNSGVAPIVTLTETGIGTYYNVVDANSYSIRNNSLTKNSLRISSDNDISFYEDTGTTPKLFWDASAESLGIGTTTTTGTLNIQDGTPTIRFYDSNLVTRQMEINAENGNAIIKVDPNQTEGTSYYSVEIDASERMRIDSTGRVGIGTSSPARNLVVKGSIPHVSILANTNTQDCFLDFGDEDDDNKGRIVYANSDDSLAFYSNAAERMRINSSGSVGIGTSSPTGKFTVSDGSFRQFEFYPENSADTNLIINYDRATNTYQNLQTRAATHQFLIGSNERMRIDSSGNLLVGKTTSSSATAGITLEPAGAVVATRDGGECFIANRKTSDGAIIQLRKDQTTVGNIGTKSTRPYFASTGSGVRIGGASILPCNSSGTTTNNTMDIGLPGEAFKDAYLSGGAYLGGTGAANKLDDYEEGSWTPTGTGVTLGSPSGTYTKVGRLVTVTWQFVYATTSSGSSASISGLPFTVGTNYNNGGNQGYVNGSAAASIAHITAATTSLYYRTANGGTSLTHADLSGATIRGSMTYMTA